MTLPELMEALDDFIEEALNQHTPPATIIEALEKAADVVRRTLVDELTKPNKTD